MKQSQRSRKCHCERSNLTAGQPEGSKRALPRGIRAGCDCFVAPPLAMTIREALLAMTSTKGASLKWSRLQPEVY
jgi:hypothetical protein